MAIADKTINLTRQWQNTNNSYSETDSWQTKSKRKRSEIHANIKMAINTLYHKNASKELLNPPLPHLEKGVLEKEYISRN